MPYPTNVPTTPPTRRSRGPVRAALLAFLVLAVLAALLPSGSAAAVFVLAVVALVAAVTVALRDGWQAAAPRRTAAAARVRPVPGPQPDTTSRLASLHPAYQVKVNAALAAGREDLARELADRYTDEALQLLTGGATAPPAHPLPTADLTPGRTPEEDGVLLRTLTTLLRRFDRYTLDAFRPAVYYRRELVHPDGR